VKEYLTVKEVAKYLKKHPKTIRRRIREKKLRAERLSGKNGIYIITRADLLEFMVSGMIEKK
jgi:excisionase family DNA binding protein